MIDTRDEHVEMACIEGEEQREKVREGRNDDMVEE